MKRATKSTLIDWAIFIAAIAVVLTALLGRARITYGDELSDRIAIAIAIETANNPWFPPKPEPKPQSPPPAPPKAAKRPKVYIAFAPFHCPPCEIQKAALLGWNPDEFELVTSGRFPIDVPFYPYTAWQDEAGKWWYLPQWNGKADLIQRWKATYRAKASAATPKRYPSFAGYRSRWSWPGDLRRHLQQTHGVSEAASLTQDQAEALHDALHEGASLQQIRARFK